MTFSAARSASPRIRSRIPRATSSSCRIRHSVTEASALARERVAAVREALLTLHPDFRAVVVLRDVNDLSYEEMSTTLRIPIGTVKSRLNRSRSMLAKALRGTAAAPGFAEERA